MTGTSSTLPRPNSRRFSASSPVGAPPVQRKTAPCRIRSIPSVVMKEGTLRRVVTTPLTRPTRTPRPARTSRIHHVREASPSLRRGATTTTNANSAPADTRPPAGEDQQDPPRARGVAFAQARGDNDNNRYQRAQRQVELAGDEHEGRPGGEYHKRRGAGQERQEERRGAGERRGH